MHIERITLNPAVMGGKPCIRGLRVTVGTILGLLAGGKTLTQRWPTPLGGSKSEKNRWLSHERTACC
jgi:hypothetical protein